MWNGERWKDEGVSRRTKTMDIHEIVRQLRAGESDRAISRSLKIDRATVKRYRTWAEKEGLLLDALPSLDVLEGRLKNSFGLEAVPQNVSSVEPYRTQVVELRK